MSLFGGNITSSVHAAMKDQHATELAETVGPGSCLGTCARKKATDQTSESLLVVRASF